LKGGGGDEGQGGEGDEGQGGEGDEGHRGGREMKGTEGGGRQRAGRGSETNKSNNKILCLKCLKIIIKMVFFH
jgi:hypothetical protein